MMLQTPVYWGTGMRYLRDINQVTALDPEVRARLAPVAGRYRFGVTPYYLSLIDWNDPADPLRRIVIPDPQELCEYGSLDPSREADNYVAPGCQHKYPSTALLVVTGTCAGYCRFCFRKRLSGDGTPEATAEPGEALAYIARHPEISNVLLTGGDPLTLPLPKLRQLLRRLRAIPHVRIIRLGTKVPAYDPGAVYRNGDLLATVARHTRPDARIYVMTHFNHPRELTPRAVRAVAALQGAGAILANQTPVLRGVNDSETAMADLMDRLSWAGVTPYYFFQNRPVAGNAGFGLTLAEAYRVVEAAKRLGSGLAKQARFVMSHASGKIEVLAIAGDRIYLKYHQARKPADSGRLLIRHLTPRSAWFDDLEPASGEGGR